MRFFKHFSRGASKNDRIYLDYASSTPLDESMRRSLPGIKSSILAANSSALHKEGVELKRALEDARALVARTLEAHSDEIVFTSSATESDNLALLGSIHALLKKGIAHREIIVFSSELEHAAVEESIKTASRYGVRHVSLATTDGVVNPRDIVVPSGIKAAIVSVMYVNNEIGTVQPIIEIAKHVRKLRKEHPEIVFIFHTDATQAPAHFSLRIPTLGVDLMTLGSTKLYCQKGVGVLYRRRGMAIEPILHGGGQEGGLRPGTEPVALIHEFACALAYSKEIKEAETARVLVLQKYFENEIETNFPQLRITAKNQPRTPHITHVAVPHFDSELLVIELDARGIAVSAKSACKNEEGNESPVVEKLYGKGWGAVRFSFGRQTVKSDVDKALSALRAVFQKYQQLR